MGTADIGGDEPESGAVRSRPRRSLALLGQLPVIAQLVLLSLLVGAGLVAILFLAVLELHETSIGGRYYQDLRERANYRRELTHLRVGLADVIAVSADARATSDPVVFGVMRDRVVDLSGEMTERFARLRTMTEHDAVHGQVVAVAKTWREFAELNVAALRALTDDGPAPFGVTMALQPLRQAQFRRQVADLDEILEKVSEDLEHHVAERLRVRVRWFVGGGAALALAVVALTALIARSITAPMHTLATAIHRVAEGHLGERLELDGASDVRAVAVAFNGMAEQLGHAVEREKAAAAAEAAAEVERRRADELEAARSAAEAGGRAKADFLAMMSHEIRTPLNGVIGMLWLLRETSLSPEQIELTDTAQHSGEHLLELINSILDFSKIEAGKLELEQAPFALRDHVAETLRTVAARAHAKGLELAFSVEPDVPDALLGDAPRLAQILLNLVGNAVKFTEHGEVVVQVALDDADAAGEALHLSVRDTGIGIPADKLAAVFEPFTQADASTTRRFGGTGLGLPIVSRLVAIMGGRVWVTSVAGQGSTFHVVVPARRAAESLNPPAAWASEPGGQRVLVADDHAVSRRLLELLLTSWGLRPTLVAGGGDALAAVETARAEGAPFSLVVLDRHMPDLDGLGVAAELGRRGLHPGTRTLILTSDRQTGDAANIAALGVFACLSKPVIPSELRLTIGRCLANTPVTAQSPVPAKVAGRRARVLLAEDSRVNQTLVVRLLERIGHGVVVAADGREAVAAWEREPFDLVLMDVQMPEMDGIQATAAIRAAESGSGRRIPIVALTAHAFVADRDRCLAAGMDAVLTKPVRAKQFYEVVSQVLGDEPDGDHADGARPLDSEIPLTVKGDGQS